MSKQQPPIVEHSKSFKPSFGTPHFIKADNWRNRRLTITVMAIHINKAAKMGHLIYLSHSKSTSQHYIWSSCEENLKSTTREFICLCGARPELVGQATIYVWPAPQVYGSPHFCPELLFLTHLLPKAFLIWEGPCAITWGTRHTLVTHAPSPCGTRLFDSEVQIIK
ncbi:hypothetical protein JCGZ_02476 [Jatropha curcas]|uniref:Uncharacterized protein n=1 Tax=Jatropha curcas TaxID=180498 RepID=A0A067JR94_JATCU|nr:hypothetical protein JCGZ_02476 [Jatropha curcas]